MKKLKIDIWGAINLTIVSALLIAFAYGIIRSFKESDCFSSENRIIVSGTIETYEYKNRGIGIDFKYNVNGKTYFGYSHSTFLCIYCDKIFIGKTFPVITCEKNSSLSEILISRQDFIRYNIPFPDSLKWIDEYSRDIWENKWK